jgi:hypothetical protein
MHHDRVHLVLAAGRGVEHLYLHGALLRLADAEPVHGQLQPAQWDTGATRPHKACHRATLQGAVGTLHSRGHVQQGGSNLGAKPGSSSVPSDRP